jgi:hypothetical protein
MKPSKRSKERRPRKERPPVHGALRKLIGRYYGRILVLRPKIIGKKPFEIIPTRAIIDHRGRVVPEPTGGQIARADRRSVLIPRMFKIQPGIALSTMRRIFGMPARGLDEKKLIESSKKPIYLDFHFTRGLFGRPVIHHVHASLTDRKPSPHSQRLVIGKTIMREGRMWTMLHPMNITPLGHLSVDLNHRTSILVKGGLSNLTRGAFTAYYKGRVAHLARPYSSKRPAPSSPSQRPPGRSKPRSS